MYFGKTMAIAALLAIPAGASAQAVDTATYVMKAGAGDLFERQSSQLVLQSTANRGVRRFAQEMLSDHAKSTAAVKMAAARARLHPMAPRLDARQARDIVALRAVHGARRDALYLQQQKMAHRQALALHQGYAHAGTVPSLKMVAAKIAPVVQHHMTMLDRM